MKKKLWKSTFVVAIALTTCIASGITYAHSPSALLSAADLLMEENLFSLADGPVLEPQYGPALEIKHKQLTLVDRIKTAEAHTYFYTNYDTNLAKSKYMELLNYGNCTDKSNIPDEFLPFVEFMDPDEYYFQYRKEGIENGKFYDATNGGPTSLNNGKPAAKIYHTREEFYAAF